MTDSLEELGRRIERVALDPDAIESQGLFRVARPLFALTGWRAKVSYAALDALLKTMREVGTSGDDAKRAAASVDLATRELEANVSTVERAAIVRRRPPVAYAAWLRRSWEIVVQASRAAEAMRSGARDEQAAFAGTSADRATVLPPLALRTKVQDDGALASEVPTKERLPETDADARLVELELAAIDRLLDAARAEQSVLGRKRRLLVAARQRLLEASAALPIEPAGARLRTDYLAREIARIDRFEHAGLSLDAGLVHQARMAVTRGDPRLAYAALAALEGAAFAGGDARVASVTSRAIGRLWPGGDPRSAAAREDSLQRSALELLGGDVVSDVNDAVAQARVDAAKKAQAARDATARGLADTERAHFGVGCETQITRASIAVGGCFEVGGAVAPVRVPHEERVLREVRHPTPHLRLVPARDVEDVPDAILTDPRAILLDLAAGRLLTRRFVQDVVRPTSRVVMRSEVRVYVVDGSGSMSGPRARVRDALLVAELSTMIARLRAPGAMRCTLFYRYFDEELGPVVRVDGVAAARAAIRDVVGTMRGGGTDIQKALVASLRQVEEARAMDPDLARAQIVLVTDGEAAVDEAVVAEARAALGGLPIGVSVIALGQENPALRALVARQRAKGEAAFYHFLDDEQLAAIADGRLDDGLPVHLPVVAPLAPKELARQLESEIGALVDELGSIERERDLGALEGLDAEVQARRESGVDEAADERGHARIEALNRDRASLCARFARWFPEPRPALTGVDVEMPPADSPDRDDVDAVVCVLASVAEVIAFVGGGDLARRADAIELVERLLPDAHLTPARYREVLRAWPACVAGGLRGVHAALAAPPG